MTQDDALTKLGVYANTAIDLAYRKGPLRAQPEPSPCDPAVFHHVLDRYDDDVVFTHVGLRGVRQAFQTDPYEFLFDALTRQFESVLAPGYTPQFRQTGVYDKCYSKPAYGTWARLFLDDAEYRTDDPIHSIMVRGPYRFDGCDHHDTFCSEGCFAQLDRDDVLVLNVGTRWLMTTQHHYVERQHDVPYQRQPTHEGVIVREDGAREEIEQINDGYALPARRAARKLQRHAVEAGVVDEYDFNGLLVLLFRAREYHDFLAGRLADDPYYLVSAR